MNRIAALALLLLTAGCSGAPDTRCGQVLDGYLAERDPAAGWLTVATLQEAEDTFLRLVPQAYADPRISDPSAACAWLDGLQVIPHAGTSWVDPWGRAVKGLAYPGKDLLSGAHLPGGTVEVGAPPEGYSWRGTALVHEWLHIVQGSVPAAPCAPADGVHCGWYAPGGPGAVVDALVALGP